MRREAVWQAGTACIVAAGVGLACGPATFSPTEFPGDASVDDASLGDETSPGGDGGPGEDATPESSGDAASEATTVPDADDSGAGMDVTLPPTDCTELPKADGAFVSTKGVDSADCTPDAPCATIAAGIAFAMRKASDAVYIDKGTYVEALKLKAGLTYSGGWLRLDNGSWQKICDESRASSVVVQAPPGAAVTAEAVDLGGTATLDTLNLQSRVDAAGVGESFYGLRVIGPTSHVILRGVSINVGAAGAGSVGATGDRGGNATMAMCSAGDGKTPAAGGNGTAAPPGTFTATAFAGAPGWQPSTGGVGNDGTGPGGNGTGEKSCMILYGCNMSTCQPNTTSYSCCSKAPSPGCGSGPGKGGKGGSGGGSSVALFIWDGTVDADGTRLTSGAGGKGGPGGAGGGGGTPTNGAQGPATSCANGCDSPYTPCNPATGSSGVALSPGAVGASGGTGGGGAGGSSYAVYVAGAGAFNPTANVALAHSTAGQGGDAPNPGAPGVGADRN